MIAIIDYGVGNLFSLASSLKSLGLETKVTRDAAAIRAADHIILPGVGAFADAMAKLEATGLVPVIKQEVEHKPLLGICLGMQLLFEKSYEYAKYDYTFDTFIVGSSNEFAYAACKAVADGGGGMVYNPLFIYGPSGLGKTHLITATAKEMKNKNNDLNIIYVTGETFSSEIINAIQTNSTTKFHDKYRSADVLLVDDIQFIAGKNSTQEEFFHTFNALYQDGKQIVLTSDRPPKAIKTLEDRIRSRFESGLIADINTPDFETRMAIIKRKAELLELKIPDDVAQFIANKLKTNIRQLEGAVKKLKALNHYAGSQPSISMAQSVIRDILNDDQPLPITVEKIIAEVANVYGVTPEDIRSTKRASAVSNARKIAIYVVREITQMPLAL